MDNVEVALERHEQKIKMIERELTSIKEVQSEIRLMNETLVTFASELKHTNEHLARHEQKIDAIEQTPKQRMAQIITAIIGAIAGCSISMLCTLLLQ